MMSKNDGLVKSPMITIVGETASGKSALALQLAQRFNGEIICADSRTVYKELNIGTAKPSLAEQNLVRHFGLDLIEPDERYNVARYKQYALEVIDDIVDRGHLPILVGGSGLYIDAILYDYRFRDAPDEKLHLKLQQLTVDELQQQLQARDIALPTNAQNPRHLIRQLETGGQKPQRSSLRPNTLVLGMQLDRAALYQRISQRVDTMLAAGLLDETRRVSARYGWDAPGMQAPAYRAFRRYIDSQITLDQARTAFIQNDRNLAKRQRTWFGRNKSIQWLSTEDKLSEAVDSATTFLNK